MNGDIDNQMVPYHFQDMIGTECEVDEYQCTSCGYSPLYKDDNRCPNCGKIIDWISVNG